MVIYFHGNGATLDRDVRARQQVPRQVTQSGLNAVLVAPQLAVDALDSTAGRFYEPGAFRRFVEEAASASPISTATCGPPVRSTPCLW